MIRVEGITKYHRREPVLQGVSLEVDRGTNLALIGPGGAGKTLITKIMAGLVKPDAGSVWIDEQEITRLNEIKLAQVRFKIGMLFQNYALFDFMDVGENIAFPLHQEGKLADDEIRDKVEIILQEVGLPGIQRKQVNELSGGMKKRVTFARAVIRNPPILIYDDPTAGLDPVTSSKIFNLLRRINERGQTTSITISHDIEGLKSVCSRWAMLSKGRLLIEGKREDIESCEQEEVRQFWQRNVGDE